MNSARRLKIADKRLEQVGIKDWFHRHTTGSVTTLLSLNAMISLNEYEICQTNIGIFRGILDWKIMAAITACRTKLDEIEAGLTKCPVKPDPEETSSTEKNSDD